MITEETLVVLAFVAVLELVVCIPVTYLTWLHFNVPFLPAYVVILAFTYISIISRGLND